EGADGVSTATLTEFVRMRVTDDLFASMAHLGSFRLDGILPTDTRAQREAVAKLALIEHLAESAASAGYDVDVPIYHPEDLIAGGTRPFDDEWRDLEDHTTSVQMFTAGMKILAAVY